MDRVAGALKEQWETAVVYASSECSMPRRPPDLERLRNLKWPRGPLPSAIRSLGSFSSSTSFISPCAVVERSGLVGTT
jgi:hypothetical protein